jgi:uncharacterized protein
MDLMRRKILTHILGGIKMNSVGFNDINIKGELAVRAGLNYARLEGQWYRPDEVFQADKHGWPADWEGRVILALTLLAQSTHRTPAYLDRIIALIPEHLNSKGYFGQLVPEGKMDEQHLSGHSWILRGLIEYYFWKKAPLVKQILETMLKNYILTAKGHYANYPIDPETRFQDPVWILSKLQTKTKHHAETSDAGCGFILIDGVTQAYEMFGWPELKELADEMINRFMEMDFIKLHIQTHATLSSLRGILRMYELEQESAYLQKAQKMFDLYKNEAWTEAYGNYNWFGAPRWTEPCAIIDSFIVATNLWKYTGNSQYLEDAHQIYYNALCHGYRINGSFGTDRCCGAKETEDNLFITPINYETYWCCTMRGGEGLSRAIKYNFFIDGNDVYIPFYNDSTATLRFKDGIIVLEEKSDYPYYGKISFEVLKSSIETAKKIKLVAPKWTGQGNIEVCLNGKSLETSFNNGFITIESTLKTGDKINFDLGLSLRTENVVFKNSIEGYHKFCYGPMLLGYKTGTEINSLEGNSFDNYAESKYKSASEIKLSKNTEFSRISKSEFQVENSSVILSCLCDIKDLTTEDSMRQLLFKE